MYVKLRICGHHFKGMGLTATMLMFLVFASEILRELHAVRILPLLIFIVIVRIYLSLDLTAFNPSTFFSLGTICTASREKYPILVIILRHKTLDMTQHGVAKVRTGYLVQRS